MIKHSISTTKKAESACIAIGSLFFLLSPLLFPTYCSSGDINLHSLELREAPMPSSALTVKAITLQECITQVLATSSELGMGKSTSKQKQALLNSSRKDLFPTLATSISSTHQTDPIPISFPDNMLGYRFTLEQPIYRGKGIITAIDQAENFMFSAKEDVRRLVNDVVYETYKQYFALLRAEKLEEQEEHAVTRLRSHLKDTQAFYDTGIVPKNDLLRSEVELAQGEQDLVDAVNRTDQTRSRLNISMNRSINAPLTIADFKPKEVRDISWEETLQQSLTHRPEIHQATLAVEAARQNLILKQVPFMPDVTLDASYANQRDYESAEANEEEWTRENTMVRVTASWQFWSWMKGSNEDYAAKMMVRRAIHNQKKISDEVALEARTAYLHLEQGAKRVVVSEKAIEQAEENYRITDARYKRQVATSTDVLDAQALLSRAMTNYYDSLYGFELAKAALWRAQGHFGLQYTSADKDTDAFSTQDSSPNN